jgi:hypothetical protein
MSFWSATLAALTLLCFSGREVKVLMYSACIMAHLLHMSAGKQAGRQAAWISAEEGTPKFLSRRRLILQPPQLRAGMTWVHAALITLLQRVVIVYRSQKGVVV